MLARPIDGVSFAENRRPANWPSALAHDPAAHAPVLTDKARMISLQHHPRLSPLASLASPSRTARGAWGLSLAVLAAATGCPSPDAEGKYDRFNEQTEDDREVPEPKMDFGAPVLPDAGAGETETDGGGLVIDGVYLVAVNTVVSPGLPLQFIGEVTAEIDGMGNGTITVVFQPLSLEQGSTTTPREEVGEALTIDGDIADFAFTLPFGETMVTGAANPITGSDIVADLALEGTIRSENAWCGTVTGEVLSPIQVGLEGSYFASTRLADRSERPTHFACDCATVDLEPGATDPEGCIPMPM